MPASLSDQPPVHHGNPPQHQIGRQTQRQQHRRVEGDPPPGGQRRQGRPDGEGLEKGVDKIDAEGGGGEELNRPGRPVPMGHGPLA